MNKILIGFRIEEVNDQEINSHNRQFEFKGTFGEAKKFLDDTMSKRIEVQENSNQEKLPF